MIAATLDTNLLASGAVAAEGTIGTLIRAWLVHRQYEVALSEWILEELARTLRKAYFVRGSTVADLTAYQVAVRQSAAIVVIAGPVPTILRSRADNLILATPRAPACPMSSRATKSSRSLASIMMSPSCPPAVSLIGWNGRRRRDHDGDPMRSRL